MIDLDHNATTPLDPRVRRAMIGALEDPHLHGNPSSVHHAGRQARTAVEQARTEVAEALDAHGATVTFTSGGTEADHIAVLGTCKALRMAGKPCGLLTSPVEHPAVLGASRALRAMGHEVAMVEPDRLGRITVDAVVDALARATDVGLVSLAAANHELGNVYAVEAITAAVRERAPEVVVHTDAVQAVGKVPVSFAGWGVDLLSMSAHKLGGPKGVGALVHRDTAPVTAPIDSGASKTLRPGTENVAGVVGLARAVRLARSELETRTRRAGELRARVLTAVREIPGAHLHGDLERHCGNTLNVRFDGCDGQLLMIALDLDGIAVSTGAACASGTSEPSPVLVALGYAEGEARGAIRISVGHDNEDGDITRVLQVLPRVVAQVRAAEGRP